MSANQTKAIELRAAGLRNYEIAKQLGLTQSTVSTLLRNCGVPLPGINDQEHIERAKTMARMFRSGKTLQQIGDQYGITRERVRQILRTAGLKGKNGGQHAKSERKRAERAARKDDAALRRWGCTYAQYRWLLSRNMEDTRDRSPVGAFTRQKTNAKVRRIPWQLKLWEWWSIWAASGKWAQRGRGQGYVMARHGDEGAYEAGNVYITSAIDNSSSGHKKSKTGLPVGVRKARKGFTAGRMLNGRKYHLGTFPTPALAHAAYLSAAPVSQVAV